MAAETTTSTKTTKKLKEQLENQSEQISLLRTRLTKVVDDIHVMKHDLDRFKSAISADLRKVIENK